jgi:hypothetical protein
MQAKWTMRINPSTTQQQPISWSYAGTAMTSMAISCAVGAADPNTGLTDPNAVVEKFIPFIDYKNQLECEFKTGHL